MKNGLIYLSLFVLLIVSSCTNSKTGESTAGTTANSKDMKGEASFLKMRIKAEMDSVEFFDSLYEVNRSNHYIPVKDDSKLDTQTAIKWITAYQQQPYEQGEPMSLVLNTKGLVDYLKRNP